MKDVQGRVKPPLESIEIRDALAASFFRGPDEGTSLHVAVGVSDR